MRAGALGYVVKSAVLSELLEAVRGALAGKTYVCSALADVVVDDYARRARGKQPSGELDKLSGREREVLQLIAEGNSSPQIAQKLTISVRTADTHRHNIMAKLDLHSIAELTRFAIRHGLCSP